LLPVLLVGVLVLLGAGLAYFIFIGVRAIYRGASKTARGAGHTDAAAGLRAILRMTVWSAFFGLLYAFLYFLGRSIGWWAAIPGILGGIAIIFCLLQADRLLTIPRGAAGQQLTIGVTIVAVFAVLVSITWFAASNG
jgi:hypothetical protein